MEFDRSQFRQSTSDATQSGRPCGWLAKSAGLVVLGIAIMFSGCDGRDMHEAAVYAWGKRGIDDGQFQTPRAIAIGPDQLLYIVDKLGRIQVFDQEGNFLRGWRTPATDMGKPCGLTFSHDGLLMVADTHYFRILFYTPDGTLIPERTIGGVNGRGPGEFGFVTDVVQDSRGNYYISEYGDYDRIQKFSPNGEFLLEWGGHGEKPGEFLRPQSLAIDENDHLWVADAANHRIQVFDATGSEVKFVTSWGRHGVGAGEFRYPYAIWLAEGDAIYVLEHGNHRIQKLRRDGTSLGQFGRPGKGQGEFHQPWAFVIDQDQRVHLLDSYNHRVQRFPTSLIQ